MRHTNPSPFSSRRRFRAAASAFALALLAGTAAPAATEVWVGGSTGAWSSGLNWQDFSAPTAGGNSTQIIRFGYTGSTAATFNNDLTGTYVLNQLLLELNATAAATLAGNALQFSGASPVLGLSNSSSATISENLVLNPTSGSVTITGSGSGGVTLSGVISEIGGARALVIAASPDPVAGQTITLSGANTFSGGVRLQSGNLVLNHNAALGTGTLTVQGGSLKVGTFIYNNNIALEQRLVIQGASTFANSTLSGSVSSSVAGTGIDARLGSSESLGLTGASSYNGTTTLDRSTPFSSAAGRLSLYNSGAALNSPSFTISSFGILDTSSGTNRIGDTAEVILRGGQLSLSHSLSSPAFAETVGALRGSGVAVVSVVTTTNNLRLQASTLNRLERGTFRFVGSALGSTFGSTVGNILFTTTPTGLTGGGGSGTTTSILPYATATDTKISLTGFAAYSATTGVRKLDEATESVSDFATAPASGNVLLSAGWANESARTINSLTIRGGSVTGSGTITLASGAMLVTATGTTTVANDLVLGAQEGFIHAFSPVLITGAISGSDGLTIGGTSSGTVELAGNNTFTGPLTVNSGRLIFSAAGALGADASPLVIGNNTVGFQYKGAAPLTMARPLETRTGVAYLENQGGDLGLATISGGGGLRFSGSGRFILAPGSTYTGPTQINSSIVQFGADSALGVGGAVDLNGGTARLSGHWTTARAISFSLGTTLDTGAFNATWNGDVTGNFILIKAGSGELNFTKANAYTGSVRINGGTVRLSEHGALRTTGFSYTVNPGGALVIDNSSVNAPDRIDNGANVTLNGASLRLIGNPSAATSEKIASLPGNWGTIELTPAGGFGTTLRLASSLGSVLVRAANLGGAAGTGFTRIVCDTNGPNVLPLQPRVVVDSSPTGTGEFFAFYDTTSDAAGVIGYRSMRASEYTSGSVIQNPTNGGTTPAFAHFVATGDLTLSGAANSVSSLTLPGNLTLAAGQTLTISWSGLLARAAAAPTTINGGTIAFVNTISSTAGILYTGGDVTLTSTITGTNGFTKSGPGLLVFDGTAAYTGGTSVLAGTMRVGASETMARQSVEVGAGATLTFATSTATLGGLRGGGTVVAPSRLTLGGEGTAFDGAFQGSVDLVLNDGNQPVVLHRFGGTSPFSGTVTMNGGVLTFASAAPFGNTPIVINGGTLWGVGAPITATLQLHSDFIAVGFSSLTLAPGATVTGDHDVWLRGAGGLNIQIPLTQTGAVRTLYTPEYDFDFSNPNPGTITVGGAQGSVLQASGVQLTGGGLKLDYTTAFTGGAGGRLGDAIPVELNGATLTLTGNSAAAVTENVGAITGLGYSGLTMTPTTAGATVLLPGSLSRADRGTFLLSATTGVLGTTATINTGKIKLPSAPAMIGGGGTVAATSIVPWAITSVGSAFGLATYDADGFRPLASNEYVTALAGAAATANVKLTGALANRGTQTINSLTFTGTQPNLTGTGKLTVTSGVVLVATAGAIAIEPDLEFGPAEAQFYLPTAAQLTVRGVISGSGGLTKSGPGGLTLSAQNTFTGPLTVNGGLLTVASATGLGAGSSPITLNGTGTGITFSETGTHTLSRPLRLGGGISTLTASTLSVEGNVSGPGGLYLLGNVVMGPGNTYTGLTHVAGTVTIADDSSLGAGAALFIGYATGIPTLRLGGDWTTSRRIEFEFQNLLTSVRIDTNGHAATLNGELADSRPSFIKSGAGLLTLTTASKYASSITLSGGGLRLSGAGSLASSTYTIGGDGLILDNTTTAVANRLADTSNLAVTSSLTLLGNAVSPVTEVIRSLSNSGTPSTITLSAPGNVGTILRAGSLTQTGTLYLRGDQLGGGPTGGFTRLVFHTPPAASTILASTSAAGGPFALATYDTASDAAGVIGFRQLRASEYTTEAEIRNATEGGATPLTAHLRLTGATTAGGNAVTVNSLTLSGTSSLTLSSAQRLTLQTAGVVVEPGASATISGGTLVFPVETPLFHTEGDLTFRSALPTTHLRKSGPGQLFLEPLTTPTLTLTVLGGSVRVGPNGPLSKSAVTLKAGTVLDFGNGPAAVASLTSAGTVLAGASTFRSAGALTVTGGDLAGTGGLEARGASSIQAPISLSGPLTVVGQYVEFGTRITMTLSGDGTALGANSLNALGQSAVKLDDASTVLNRIGAVPVTLNGSDLTLIGNAQTAISRNLGALTATGAITLTADAFGRQPVALGFSSFVRHDRGTLLFFAGGDSFTLGPMIGEGQAAVTLGGAPALALVGANTTATNRAILPFASARQGTSSYGNTLVTYDPMTGIRGLAATEYSPSLSAGDNVLISNSLTNNANLSINSLTVTGIYDLAGTGTLSIASGAVMSRVGSARITNNLAFGAAEAVIMAFGSGDFSINGMISGTGGLTKTGSDLLRLSGANTFTGPLTINQGTLAFSSAGNLGPDTSEIVLNDGTLAFTGTTLNLTRGIRLSGYSRATIAGPSSAGNFVLAAPITGTGQLFLTGRNTFTAANTFTGDLSVTGTLTFGNDAALGNGTLLTLGGGLVLSGPWTTNRTVYVSSNTTIDTAGFDASLAKLTATSSFASFSKNGSGRLTIPDASGYLGSLIVAAGEMQLDGALPASSGNISVSSGAVLSGSMQGTRALSVSGTLSPGDEVGTIASGSLTFQSNSTFAMEVASASSYDQVSVTGAVSLSGPVQLTLSLGYDPDDLVDSFTLILNDGTDAVSLLNGGRFVYAGTTLNEGTELTVNGQPFQISYAGGTGNDVVLTAVPEPAGAGLLLVGALALATRRKRS